MDTISKQNNDSIIWQNIIAENNRLTEVAVFIKRKYPNNLDIEEIREIVKLLVDDYSYTYEEITNGIAIKTLLPMLGIKEAKQESVKKQNDVDYNLCPFKVAPKHIDSKTKVKRLFVGAVAAATLFVGANALVDNYVDSRNALDNISATALQVDNNDNAIGTSIVDQCMEVSGYNNGQPIYSLNKDKLVQKIEYLCSLNKDLFDVYLSNVYFDLDYDRLNIMNSVLLNLQQDFAGSEEYQEIFNRIKNHKDYLDYMMSLGIINSDRSDYQDIMKAINKYREYEASSIKDIYGSYAKLTEAEQQNIIIIREEYRSYKNRQNYQHGDEINELTKLAKLDDEFGGRSSGS